MDMQFHWEMPHDNVFSRIVLNRPRFRCRGVFAMRVCQHYLNRFVYVA